MNNVKNFFLAAVAAAFLISTAACEKAKEQTEGAAEKAGAAVGQAVDQAKEKTGEAMEKTGDAMNESSSDEPAPWSNLFAAILPRSA